MEWIIDLISGGGTGLAAIGAAIVALFGIIWKGKRDLRKRIEDAAELEDYKNADEIRDTRDGMSDADRVRRFEGRGITDD